MPQYPINWNDEKSIRRIFSYQTRIGIAPKFGSRPIGWYQSIQCEQHDKIMKALAANALDFPVMVRKQGDYLMVWLERERIWLGFMRMYDLRDYH